MKLKQIRLILALLLPVLAGCSGMDTLRLGQDMPGDLDNLLEQHEYARARQLTSKYTYLDSSEVQTRITSEEIVFTGKIASEARQLESENDLLGAVQILSDALQKVPHSASLRELRSKIEPERVKQLQTNEREKLLAHANFVLEQQQLYLEQINLQSPALAQRWKYARNQKEAKALTPQLIEQGRKALQNDKPGLAKTYLQLSQALHETPEAGELLTGIYADEKALRQATIKKTRIAQKKAEIRDARNREQEVQDDKKKTETLLAETRQALAKDELLVARAAFVQIPSSAVTDSEVLATQDDLVQAVAMRVKKLIKTGDVQYRADYVLKAVRTWTKALSLDPDNQELRERVERANKVLARLEELKRQQHRQQPVLSLPVQPTRVGATRTSPRH